MSLHVDHLTRFFGQQRAVNDISFVVNSGEIVGFLGPNGAGKSTTMKIATTCLSPSTGSVRVGAFDVVAEPLKARKITGYLPEHNPLYLDMFVHEYLAFVSGIFGIRGSEQKRRIGEMIELCGLTAEQNKRIESLSKGYRQRVGLAQALIHDPEVLILDEPTTGLDPNQIVEIRKLIRHISAQKTVIFSTHIMQEVQAICDRVIVINKGEIVADDDVAGLLARKRAPAVLAEFERGISIEDLRKIPGVASVHETGHLKFRITATENTELRAEIFRYAAEKNLSLIGLKQEENSLEDIFKELTTS
jgi:ABC-2 type transport system ATP-binding protein